MPVSVVVMTGTLAALAVVGLGVVRPRVSASIALGLAPWAVFAGLLHGLSHAAAYGGRWTDLLGFPGIVPTVVVLVAGVWLCATLIGGRSAPGAVGSLLAASGYGAVLPPLLLAVAIMAGSSSPAVVPPLAVVVLVAICSGLAVVLLTRASPNTITVLGAGSALLVFGHLLDAMAGALLLGPSDAPLPGYELTAGIEDPMIATGTYVGGRLLLALIVALVATEWARRHDTGYIVAAVVGAAGLAAGVTTLTLVATGLA